MLCRVLSTAVIAGLLLFPGSSYALESGPSNTVGYWKFDVHPGFTQISFPLLPEDKSLDSVLNDQLTGASTPEQSDQIMRWNAGSGQFQVAWYNSSSNSWEGDFTQLSEAESYWIYVQPDHPATQTIVASGSVIEEPWYDMGQMVEGYNAVGSVWAVAAPVVTSGLDGFTGGLYLFLSDLIMSYDPGSGSYSYAWKDGSDQWQGSINMFEPIKGYWLYVAPGHTGFEWATYPQPNPAVLDFRTLPVVYPQIDVFEHLSKPPMPTKSDLLKRNNAKESSK